MTTFVPTLHYQQTQKMLQQKKAAGEIDEVEYFQRLDELITKEAHDQQNMVLDLTIQEMREAASRNLQSYEQELQKAQAEIERAEKEAERAKAQKQRSDEDQRRQRDQKQQREQEKEAERQRQARYTYRFATIPNEITSLKKQYYQAKNHYTWLQVASIVFSILTTTLVGTDIFPRWIAVVCSGLAAMAATFLSTFRMREHNYGYYQAISNMESEVHDYDQRVGGYAALDEEQAYRRFTARISEIKQQYMSHELSMWKAPESPPDKNSEGTSKQGNSASAREVGERKEDEKQEQDLAKTKKPGEPQQAALPESDTSST